MSRVDQFYLASPHFSFDVAALLGFDFPKTQDRRGAEKTEALYLLPGVFMRHVIEARIELGKRLRRDPLRPRDLVPVHCHDQGNQRKRERCVGSRTTSSGVPLSKPVAESDCRERSATGVKSFSNIWLSLRSPSHTR